MSRKLQFAAHAYDKNLSDSDITDLEDGAGAYAANGCNTNSGHGAYPSDNNAIPSDFETLPYDTTSGYYAYRTGSTSTSACVSRFGIQDLTGNIWEWVSDQINAGVGISSPLVPSNTDLNGLNFDNNEAVNSSDAFQNHPAVNLALGIPMAASAPSGWATSVGAGVGVGEFATAKLHWDYLSILTAGSRGGLVGGHWLHVANSGRFYLDLSHAPSVRHYLMGFRCSAPA